MAIRQDNIVNELCNWWPQPHARAIVERIADLFENIDQPTRAARRPRVAGFVDSLIYSGKAALMQWSPRPDADKRPHTSTES